MRQHSVDSAEYFVARNGAVGCGDLHTSPINTNSTVALQRLALYLSPIALQGEFRPMCPWAECTSCAHDTTSTLTHASVVTSLGATFRYAVARCVADAGTVAVSFSGGIDSLAVLWNLDRYCRSSSRRLIAITANLVDDEGQHSKDIAARQIASLGIKCEHVVVNVADALSWPPWTPAGPRLDAMPEVNSAINECARLTGAAVLLTGEGADELLGCPRFIGPALVRHNRSDVPQYMADVGRQSLWKELLAALSRLLPRSPRQLLYWVANWPEMCSTEPYPVLSQRFRESVRHWGAQWLRHQVTSDMCAQPWSLADAYYSRHPWDPLPPAGPIPTASPFLDPIFVRRSEAIPVWERYAATLSSSYHRRKSVILGFLPPEAAAVIPRQKQIFTQAFIRYQERWPRHAPVSTSLGLIDSTALRSCDDPSVLLQVRAIEHWLRYCVDVGYRIVDS